MEKLTIALLGRQGAGKSASGNTLLGSDSFHTAASSKPVTRACLLSFATVDQQMIEVIDTPGWCDSSQFDTEMKLSLIKCINEYKPQVFLLVLPIGRFTVEEINTVLNILKGLGDEVIKYMIVLFTNGDDLENGTIEDYLKDSHKDLERIIRICGKRYHVFNNKERKDRQQISSLLKKINDLVGKNEQNRHTKVMDQKKQMSKHPSSVPEKLKSHDDQGKNKERELMVYRKEFEEFKSELNQKFQEYTENMEKQMMEIKEKLKPEQQKEQICMKELNQNIKDFIEEYRKNMNELLPIMKELKPVQQKADPKE